MNSDTSQLLISQFRWGNESAFSLLLVIPILMGFYVFFHYRNKHKLDKAFGTKIIPWLTQSIDIRKRHFQMVIQMLALFFLIVALARPQLGQSSLGF